MSSKEMIKLIAENQILKEKLERQKKIIAKWQHFYESQKGARKILKYRKIITELENQLNEKNKLLEKKKICPECGKEAKRLEKHHDPPKSKLKKLLAEKGKVEKNDRRMCPRCHRKEDKKWGVNRKKGYRKKGKKFHLKWGHGRVLYK